MKRLLQVLAVAAVAAALVGCGAPDTPESSGESSDGGGQAAAGGDAVKIGVLTGLTGDYGPWGEAGLAAARIAADEINAAGGIDGRKIELVVADNQSSVEGAISGWKKIVEIDKVNAVLGSESDAAVSLVEESAAAQVPIMCPVCGAPSLDELGGDYIFRLVSSDAQLGVAYAQAALARTKKIAAITQRGLEATEGITEVFLAAFEKGGGEVAADLHFTPDATSFQSLLNDAFGKSDYVLLSSGLEPGTRLLSEWQRRSYDGFFYMTPEMISPDTATSGRGRLEEKAFAVGQAYVTDSPAWGAFAEVYEAEAGKAPSLSLREPEYYDQLILVALAATAAGEVSGKAIRDNLVKVANEPGTVVHSYEEGVAALKKGEDIAYSGASGPIEFDDHGGVIGVYSELVVKGKEWSELPARIELDLALLPE